jgi:hypothetical protein
VQIGKQPVGQMGEVLTGKLPMGSLGAQDRGSYVEVVVEKRNREKSKIPAMVMEENTPRLAGELTTKKHVAGDESAMLLLESAKDKGPVIVPRDCDIPNGEMLSIHVMEGNVQALKE